MKTSMVQAAETPRLPWRNWAALWARGDLGGTGVRGRCQHPSKAGRGGSGHVQQDQLKGSPGVGASLRGREEDRAKGSSGRNSSGATSAFQSSEPLTVGILWIHPYPPMSEITVPTPVPWMCAFQKRSGSPPSSLRLLHILPLHGPPSV